MNYLFIFIIPTLLFSTLLQPLLVNNAKIMPTSRPSAVIAPSTPSVSVAKFKMLKDVGEAYMDQFGLTEDDFKKMQKMGVTVLESNFDICAGDQDVKYFLDMSQKYSMKVILPAGSGEAEWGYQCDKDPYPKIQKPVWNKKGVVAFVTKWKNHPAVYAWDTSNEAGSVLPNANPDTYQFMLNLAQLRQAYKDVKQADPNHPIMVRQNGWFYYDQPGNFFREGNPFGKGVADIVMINAYSNVAEYFPDFVKTVTSRSMNAIKRIDPDAEIIVSLGVWDERPLWHKPTVKQLQNDLKQLNSFKDVIGVAYFKYGAKGSEWYMPENSSDLVGILSK